MKQLAILSFVLAAACGGGKKPAPVEPEPAPEPVATSPTEPPPPEPGKVEEAKEEPPPMDPKVELLAGETAAYDGAKPAFEKWCKGCHMKGEKNATEKKLKHFDISAYPFTGEHAATIGTEVATSLGLTGKKATMPKNKPGSVAKEDLELIKKWIEAWDASEKGGAHAAPSK